MNILRFTLIAFLTSWLFPGQIEFERFTIDDGLSQNTVYEVFQDSRGYLWMGTQGGLDRFNGYEFKQYEHESSDTTSIVDGWIRCIQEDEDGILWLGTVDGNFGWFNPFEEVGGEIDLYENHPGIQRPARIDKILFHKDYIFFLGLFCVQFERSQNFYIKIFLVELWALFFLIHF